MYPSGGQWLKMKCPTAAATPTPPCWLWVPGNCKDSRKAPVPSGHCLWNRGGCRGGTVPPSELSKNSACPQDGGGELKGSF